MSEIDNLVEVAAKAIADWHGEGAGKCTVCGAQDGKYRLGNCPDQGQEFCEQCGQCACLSGPDEKEYPNE